VFRRGKRVSLRSRNNKTITNHYPELAEAIQRQRADRFIADGEQPRERGVHWVRPELAEEVTRERAAPVGP
jgi:ATP-dependent DNA ligase